MDDSNELTVSTLSAIRAVAQRASRCSPSVESFASRCSPSVESSSDLHPPVIHRLYDAQKRYDRNRAERQRAAEEAAHAEIRPGPRINARSARLASGNLPIEARSEELKQMRERALECERQLIRERKEADVTGAPSIRPQSQRLHRTVDDLMRWEDQKQKKRSVQQHRLLEEQKRTCTFKPKTRSSSADRRWTRNNGQGSNEKASLCSTPTSTTASTFLSSEPLSFEAFQHRLNTPTAVRCRSTGAVRCRSTGSQNTLPFQQKPGDEFSFVDSPEYINLNSCQGSPRNESQCSGGDEPAPEAGPAQDSSPLSAESMDSHPSSRQGSRRQIISTSPVRPSTGFRLQRSSSGNSFSSSGRCLARTASFGRSGKVASKDASISSARCNAPCNVVEYSCDWQAVLAIARRGGA